MSEKIVAKDISKLCRKIFF